MSAETLLALRDDWKYVSLNLGFDLAPGTDKLVFESNKHGYVILGGVLTDNPNLKWMIDLETARGKNRNEFSLLQLFTFGLTSPTANGWFISKYDAILNLYAVAFAPSEWWPWYTGFKFWVSNPTSGYLKVIMATMLGIEFAK